MLRVASVAICLSLLTLSLLGCRQTPQPTPPAPPAVTAATPLSDELVVFREFTGRTEPVETVDIRARVRGYLREITFTEGDPVEANAVLYRIEPEQYQAALQAAQAQEKEAEAELDRAKFEYERLEGLFQNQVAARSEYVDAEATYKGADAAVLAAKAQVTQAQLDLDYTTIRSPIAGRANRTTVDVGNLVGPSESDVLTTIVPWNPIYVYFTISERSVLEFRRQQARTNQEPEDLTVYIRLADGTEYAHTGTIDYSDNTLDPATGTLRVRAIFPNPDSLLIPGIFTRVRIPKEPAPALLVPDVALQRDLAGYFLMIVDDQGVASRVNVETGDRADEYREIISGLKGDERVIINGLQRLRGGSKVSVTETTLAPLGEQKPVTEPNVATTTPPTSTETESDTMTETAGSDDVSPREPDSAE